jgi:hypothetical protein
MSYNPVEDAYKAGRWNISQEEAVGLRGGMEKKKKSSFWKLAKMAIMGNRYKEPKATK